MKRLKLPTFLFKFCQFNGEEHILVMHVLQSLSTTSVRNIQLIFLILNNKKLILHQQTYTYLFIYFYFTNIPKLLYYLLLYV